jgi:hypothetical protein
LERRLSILRRRRASRSAPPTKRLPQPSSRCPPACPHHHTASVALKPGPCLSLSSASHQPLASREPLAFREPRCPRASRRRPLTRVRTRVRLSARARGTARCSLLCRSEPLARCSACPSIRRSQPSRVTTRIQLPASRPTPSPPPYPPFTLWLPRPAVVPHYHPYI